MMNDPLAQLLVSDANNTRRLPVLTFVTRNLAATTGGVLKGNFQYTTRSGYTVCYLVQHFVRCNYCLIAYTKTAVTYSMLLQDDFSLKLLEPQPKFPRAILDAKVGCGDATPPVPGCSVG